MNIKADKFTAIDFPRLIENANKELEENPGTTYNQWIIQGTKAHDDYDHFGEAIYLLCAMQVMEAEMIRDDPEACAGNEVVNGGFI